MHRAPLWTLLFLFLFASPPGLQAQGPTGGKTPIYSYRVVRSYLHDPQAFTQGLAFADGVFYEGTGLYGRSSLRKVDPETGRVLMRTDLPPAYFGEGIAVMGDRIVQITWQSRIGFIYDKKTFRLLKTFSYPYEGWGITHDGRRFFMSDGSSVLHILSAKDLREIGVIKVHDHRGPVTGLNELEYVKGEIYANIWPTDDIAVINPGTGRVKAVMNMKRLLDKRETLGADVLNGIAYDSRGDRLFVTGKFWPKILEIKRLKAKTAPK
jgi:glutamine cyclotransferase